MAQYDCLLLPHGFYNTFPLLPSPCGCTHYVGVAGFVVNGEGEVLLVQEKWIRGLGVKHWKLPGGHTEKGLYMKS